MKGVAVFLVCILAIFLCDDGYCQGVRRKGTLTTVNGTAIQGWIHYKNWDKNPRVIALAADSANSRYTNYTIAEIQSVQIDGLDWYEKMTITRDARPIALAELLAPQQDSLVTDTVLLRAVVLGEKFELYELVDFKQHYFIKTPHSGITELIYRLSLNESGNVLTDRRYITQLKTLLANMQSTPELLNKIEKAAYKEKDLKNAVLAMNSVNQGAIVYKTSDVSKKIMASFFIDAGIGYSCLTIKGSYPPFNKMKFDNAFVPSFGIGIDISSVRNLQDITIRAELNYSSIQYKGAGTKNLTVGGPGTVTTSYVVQQSNIGPSLGLNYHFIRKERLRAYLGACATYNFAFYSKNLYTENNPLTGIKETGNYLDLPRGWSNFSARGGVKLNNQYELAFNAQLSGDFTNYVSWSLAPNTYSFHVRYFF